MKKGILIILGMFIMVSTIEANNGKNLTNSKGLKHYNYNNSVNFFENGIEFFVFTNGYFDYDTHYNNRRFRVNRNYNGRIRSIGNIIINYDYRGNVSRIGSIILRYRSGQLTNVGDLRIRYNNWNYPVFYGNVRNYYYNNGIRFNVSFGYVCDYNDTYFFNNDFRRNYIQIREDNNFFYYKAKTNAKIGKRSTILKRRKPFSILKNRKKTLRNNNSTRKNTNSNRRTIKKHSTRNNTNVLSKNNIKHRGSKNKSYKTRSNSNQKRKTKL